MGKIRIIELGYTQEERFKEVDKSTKATIKSQYEIEDEIKLLRRAIVTLANQLNIELPQEFLAYNTMVEDVVTQGKKRKKHITINKIQIRRKGDKGEQSK